MVYGAVCAHRQVRCRSDSAFRAQGFTDEEIAGCPRRASLATLHLRNLSGLMGIQRYTWTFRGQKNLPRAFFGRDYALRGQKTPPHPRKRPRREFTPSDPPPFMLHGAKATGVSSYFASRPGEVHTYRPFEALQAHACAVSINLPKSAGACRKSAQESSSLTFPYQTDPEMSKHPGRREFTPFCRDFTPFSRKLTPCFLSRFHA